MNRKTRGRNAGSRADQLIEQIRLPPQSIEAEQAVLGGLMLVPESYDRVADALAASDFYRHDHQLIYRAIKELAEKGKPYDAVTLGEWFESMGLADQVAGGAYLVELASTTPSAANIMAYAEIVRDKAILRQMIAVGTHIVNEGFRPDGRDTHVLLDAAERDLLAVREAGRNASREVTTLIGAAKEAFDLLQKRYDAGGGITGLETGYGEFDKLTAGLQAEDLIILAARPSQGKTTLALNIAEHVARSQQMKTVLMFSMEMSAAQLTMRLISALGRIDAQRLRTGDLQNEDWSRVTSAFRLIREMNVLIDDTSTMSPEGVRARARRIAREYKESEKPLGLIVIDYLQLMEVPGNEENRATEVSTISRNLKALARELKVPVIALSQLNRSLETRSDKRPVMSDLRESGAIEQDADMIVFIYRDEYYNKDSQDKGLAEIIIGKQRNGPTGTFKLRFNGTHSRFDNLAHDSYGSFE